jgi:translation initiation factor 2 subunit 2
MSMSSDEEYEQLLDKVYKNLPEKVTSSERFEMPVFEFFTEGNKTIIKNFKAVSDRIRRSSDVLGKYLSKELAVPVSMQGDRLTLQRQITGDILNKKLEEYVNKLVICKQCNRPDTHIEELGHGMRLLICEACGARATVR